MQQEQLLLDAMPVFARIGDLQGLLTHFPRLNELAIHTRGLPAGLVEVLAPRVRGLELASRAINDKLMSEIATSTWPQLRSLAVHVPWRNRSSDKATALEPMMRGNRFPALVDLRVREHGRAGGFTERFCMEIVKAPLLAQLEVLDFTTRDLDVDIVRPSHPQLRHLKHFLPSADEETDVEALEQLTYLLEEPDTHRAIRLTRKVRDLATSQFDLHNINRRLGTALSLIREFDDALIVFDASLENEPSCGVTLQHKAWTLKCVGRIDEAVEVLRQAEATRRHPARASLLYLKASLDVARGKRRDLLLLNEARGLFIDDLQTRVVDADLHYELACVHALMGDTAAALETLSTTLDLCPHYKAWAEAELDFAAIRDTDAFRAVVEHTR